VGIRIVYRCPYVSATDLFIITQEKQLETYVQRYLKKRLRKIYQTDLGNSLFLEDLYYWDNFKKEKNDVLGHLFRLKRVKKLIERHESLILKWIAFMN